MQEKCYEGDVAAVFKPRGVESFYVVCDGECSVTCPGYNVVDVNELLGDAEASILGEVVAASLLTPPERVEGDESVIEEARSTYLLRVACEEHERLRRILRSLSSLARVAHIYFIVARAARLSRIYPWVATAVTMMLREKPKRLAEDAAKVLRELGCGGDDTWFEPCGERRRRTRGWKLVSTRLTRIWPLVKPGGVGNPLLRDPLLLVKLPRGRLRTKLLDFEEQLYAVTGVSRVLKARIEGFVGSVTLYRGGFRSAIVKRYLTPATAKWVVAAGISLPIYPYRLDPRSRLEAEYTATVSLLDLGFPVPEPILVDPRGFKAAYEYIQGTPLHHLVARDPGTPSFAEAAMLLAQLHREGWVMGDANPGNFIVARNSTYIIDLEQARRSTLLRHRAWDLAVLVYYSLVFNPREAGQRAALAARAYIAAGGERSVVREAARVVYAIPFAAAAPINMLEKARRALLHVAGESVQ